MFCLFTDEEMEMVPEGESLPPSGCIVEGIVGGYGFHSDRLSECREKLVEMIGMLPEGFNRDSGGGWSFLNLCETKDGILWTGFQKTCGEFFCLCKGLRLADYLFPRSLWGKLPGGVPYIVFNRDGWGDGEMPSEHFEKAVVA